MAMELLQSTSAESRFRLDPRTKLILMVLINAVIFSGAPVKYIVVMAAIPVLLLTFCGKPLNALLAIAAFSLSAAGTILLVPRVHGILNILVVMVVATIYRLMPGVIMGYYLVTTTTVSEFTASMERMHVPQCITIPLSVMFRFFPTVVEESSSISDAMRMRGLTFGSGSFLRRPGEMIEYRLIPLLMSAVKIGEELSAASLTRGMGGSVKRTNICNIGFRALDIILLLIAVPVFIMFLIY